MKTILKIIFAPVIWLIQACNPLGNPVDQDISDSHFYNKKKTDVIYSPMGNWFELGKTPLNVDIESFQVLNNKFCKDKNHAYYLAAVIEHQKIDVASFTAKTDDWMWHIGLDKEHVYYLERDFKEGETIAKTMLIEGADPNTYKKLDENFAKDDQHYFFDNKMIDVDYASFKKVNKTFYTDKKEAYYFTYQLFKSFSVARAKACS